MFGDGFRPYYPQLFPAYSPGGIGGRVRRFGTRGGMFTIRSPNGGESVLYYFCNDRLLFVAFARKKGAESLAKERRMNILFFLTPKASCDYLYDDYTIRQAMEKMQKVGYSAIPIISRDGAYRGALTEGDLLWAVKDLCQMDLRKTEEHSIMEIHHRRDNRPVPVSTEMSALLFAASDQNFVPVIDDKGAFIGLVTRRAIMQYWLQHFDTSDM